MEPIPVTPDIYELKYLSLFTESEGVLIDFLALLVKFPPEQVYYYKFSGDNRYITHADGRNLGMHNGSLPKEDVYYALRGMIYDDWGLHSNYTRTRAPA